MWSVIWSLEHAMHKYQSCLWEKVMQVGFNRKNGDNAKFKVVVSV